MKSENEIENERGTNVIKQIINNPNLHKTVYRGFAAYRNIILICILTGNFYLRTSHFHRGGGGAGRNRSHKIFTPTDDGIHPAKTNYFLEGTATSSKTPRSKPRITCHSFRIAPQIILQDD